jgi:broad specificity phosphatase PhoE
LLGEYWLKLGITFDEVLVGPRQRQIRTEEIVRAVFDANASPWPKAEILAAFDEHCVDRLLGQPLDELTRLHPTLQPLAADYRSAAEPDQIQRSFQRLFEAICHLWCTAATGTGAIESWNDFHARVVSELRRILDHSSRNRTIAVFTSVGNITAALCFVLGCTPARALELGWRLRNCSVTELIFSGNRITLDHFNNLSHLADQSTWTFR